jgi:hypothetical protein
MKKSILAFIAIAIATFTYAQNVGVGTATPAEKLDVNGNVNVQGNLKVNGDAGQPGQVLRVNNDGSQSWANMFGYKNRKMFTSISAWTVPAGVKEIMIEAVGAGGGGAKGGGGSGGAYAVGVYKIAPGTVISIFAGIGGAGSSTETGSGFNGGDSYVILNPQINIAAQGGREATANGIGASPYSYISGDSLIFEQHYRGGLGKTTVESYSQLTATEYVTMRKYGDGGASAHAPHYFQRGTFLSFNTVSLTNISLVYGGSGIYSEYGSGGAGGNTPAGGWGFYGQSGFVAISW